MPNQKRKPATDPAIQAAHLTSSRAFKATIVGAIIVAITGIFVAFINGWFSIMKPVPTPDKSIYRVRVTVLDPQGVPTEDAKVWSSFGGEPKQVAGGWQFDIPAESKPQNGNLTIFASNESAFLVGKEELTLNADFNSAIIVPLKLDTSASVSGQVIDNRRRPVIGAHVYIDGYEKEAVTTNRDGKFELPAHAAVRQKVLLFAERKGIGTAILWHPAGDSYAELMLQR
jgi:hypothetical protein